MITRPAIWNDHMHFAYSAYRRGILAAWASAGHPHTSDEIPVATESEMAAAYEGGSLAPLLLDQMRERMAIFAPEAVPEIETRPVVRKLGVFDGSITMLLATRQSVEWFQSSSVFNFDFVAESMLGLHDEAVTVLDLGGHIGVWSCYYSRLVSRRQGRVYSFEPSMVNVEAAHAQFMLNGISNVYASPQPIGPPLTNRGATADLLVDFVSDISNFASIDAALVLRPDFVKIDIEGFEFDLCTGFPDIFKQVPRMHLELHIPHLERRGLDWRQVYRLIPFDEREVILSRGSDFHVLSPDSHLEGYCSIFIKPIGE